MKKILLFVLIPYFAFSATSRLNRKILLECNMSAGEYQAIRVYQDDDKLTLYMLNNRGSLEEKILPKKQWIEQKITIPCQYTSSGCGYVYKSNGSWVYKTGYYGWYNFGYCQ